MAHAVTDGPHAGSLLGKEEERGRMKSFWGTLVHFDIVAPALVQQHVPSNPQPQSHTVQLSAVFLQYKETPGKA